MELIYTQHRGASYLKQQDCLWNGFEALQSLDQPVTSKTCQDIILVAVADGVSGSPCAALASNFVISALKDAVDLHGFTNRAFRSLQNKLGLRYSRTNCRGASTTLLAARFIDQTVSILSVGDSRAYLLKYGRPPLLLTKDHSFINQLRDDEVLDDHKDYASCYNVLTDCLIADSDESDFNIFFTSLKLEISDRVLICTDGVYETLGAELADLISHSQSLEVQGNAIRERILQIGAEDNFSMLIVEC